MSNTDERPVDLLPFYWSGNMVQVSLDYSNHWWVSGRGGWPLDVQWNYLDDLGQGSSFQFLPLSWCLL